MMNNGSETCRVCLDTDISNKTISLFEKHKNLLVFEHINAIANINISLFDGLPDKICQPCYLELESAIVFKRKCETSNVILKNEIENETKLISMGFMLTKKEEYGSPDIKLEEECDNKNFYLPEICIEECSAADIKLNSDVLTKSRKSRAIDLKLECHDCGEIFKSKCKLSVHWKKMHMLTDLICTVCKRVFKSYKALHMHKKRKSKSCVVAQDENVNIEGIGKSRKFVCKVCNYVTNKSKDLSAHLVIHSGDRPYQCDRCSNRFTQQSSLQSHQENVHNKFIVEITCQFCGKYVKGRNKVYRHLRNHTDKRVPCTVCGKIVRGVNYHIHMRRHTGTRPYACDKCPSRFVTRGELCNHTRYVHSKKDNYYKCELCDYKSIRPHIVKNHISRHTDSNVACKICGRFFLSVERLASHEKTHVEQEKNYSCPHCGIKFFKQDSAKRHIKAKHMPTVVTIEKKDLIVIKKETPKDTPGVAIVINDKHVNSSEKI